MRTINFLSGDNARFLTGTGSWSVASGTIASDAPASAFAGYHTLKISPTSTSTVTVSLSGIPVPVTYADSTIQFHCRLKCSSGVSAAVTFTHNQTMPTTYEQTRSTRVGVNTWGVSRSNLLPVPNVGTSVMATISLALTNHQGDDIFLAIPFLYGTTDVNSSIFTLSTWAEIPYIFKATEQAEVDAGILPEYPSLRFIECGLSAGDDVFDALYAIEYVDVETAGQINYTPSESSLVSPYGVTDATGAWLAQFLGFQLDNPQQTVTPWGGLPSTWAATMTAIDATGLSASPTSLSRSTNVVTAVFGSAHNLSTNDEVSVIAVDGTSTSFSGTFVVTGTPDSTTATWAQTGTNESASETHTVALVDTSWGELEESNPDVFDKAGYTAWQLANAYSGLNAGTLAALTGAAEYNLSGDKIVTVVKHYSGDPWRILVKTKTSETPGGSNNVENEIILNALLPVKPLGYKVNHECTASGS